MADDDKKFTADNGSFWKAKKRASGILKDPERLKKLLTNSAQKIREVGNDNESLQRLKDQVNTLNRMIRAYAKGEYRNIPWKNALMITAGIVYFVTPLDLIPDFIPLTGFLDDLTVLMWVFNSVRGSIEEFEDWENSQAEQVK
ncbi:YkvA family protein [Porifericola rhodea]|uniref:YkvA family protein n=1 Tax=Porifericola rhodea TaxID=930972 RepID=UPI0026652DAB|nr:YkvA family protein [Porifericola rhodea]WKN33199.1 YkvA family protein [Porifericola rhodea]